MGAPARRLSKTRASEIIEEGAGHLEISRVKKLSNFYQNY